MILYVLIGALAMVALYYVYKPIKKLISYIKIRRSTVGVSKIASIEKDIEDLKSKFNELSLEIQTTKELLGDTQKANTYLYPENFDTSKEDGKTVFVKNGEEKSYETIDWRSR